MGSAESEFSYILAIPQYSGKKTLMTNKAVLTLLHTPLQNEQNLMQIQEEP